MMLDACKFFTLFRITHLVDEFLPSLGMEIDEPYNLSYRVLKVRQIMSVIYLEMNNNLIN